MERLWVKDILTATGGQLLQGPRIGHVKGISTDTRTVNAGELFIPLIGENFDGHRFIRQAAEKGAAGVLIGQGYEVPEEWGKDGAPFVIRVGDTLRALQDLARWYRTRFDLPVVAVTGSNGKTTTKDMVAAILSRRWKTLKTEGNYNNEIGLPLTLLRLDKATQAAVVEMGMRGAGQIEALAHLAKPTVGIVTNVGEVHMELLGSREAIARAKAELVAALDEGGLAVLNADDPRVAAMRLQTRARVLTFGVSGNGARIPVDCLADNIQSHGIRGVIFRVSFGGKNWRVDLPVPGTHNVYNALAAACTALGLGFAPEEVAEGLAGCRLSKMRLEAVEAPGGWLVINDAYNASPASMRAALQILAESRDKGRIVAVLGDMGELGGLSEEAHRAMGEFVLKLGIDWLVTVGAKASLISQAARQKGFPRERSAVCATNAEALKQLDGIVQPGDVVLVKGSRVMKMEEVVTGLTGQAVGAH
ncbi:MAG: UDP-N-acetylmuramoyl-tripeptide--D-alanyl-D-alanine ligase [Firmicutes bacterium]|nr:UDP-N-acetylmuramoyl-tripeptide--D-alanyl-D-alanine ligase [Bacillota bacterium]